MALIFGLSSIPRLPEIPGAGLPHLDKLVHVVLYATLCVLFLRARTRGWSQPVTAGGALLAVVFTVLYGISDELHQSFVPPREVDALDLAADAAGGAVAATALYAGIIRMRT